MSHREKHSGPKVFDLPLLVGIGLTAIYYAVLTLPMFQDSLLARYTTHHVVEYAIVAFFLWGVADVGFHIARLPRERMALGIDWLPGRRGHEPASQAAHYLQLVEQQPTRWRNTHIGRRLDDALTHLAEKGSTDGLPDYLRQLADQDYERVSTNYAVLRFICWVTPMFGFLGTVVHFGTALAGKAGEDLSAHLPAVMSEMGTAFNTTTAALTAAVTTMFAVFLCERAERSIVESVDIRVERELMNRFEASDASLAPFLNAVRESSHASLSMLQAVVAEQAQSWAAAIQSTYQNAGAVGEAQTAAWTAAMTRMEQRFDEHDARREANLNKVLETLSTQHKAQMERILPGSDQLSGLRTDLAQFVESLSELLAQRGELAQLQTALADNLRLLRDTQQIDQAVHGLSAAIHLLTARSSDLAGRRAA